MKKIIFIICPILMAFIVSCSGDYDNFVGSTKYLNAPSNVSNVTSEELPGQIKLKWSVPSDSNYYYVQIKYFDHLTQTEKAKVVSVYNDSVIIDNTRQKFGDYDFTFQTFNSKNEGGAIQTMKAKSGRAPITETISATKIPLTVSQLSSNAQEPNEGPIANLIDNNANTFFHTKWSGGGQPWPHWIDVKLNSAIENVQFYYKNRNGSEAAPTNVDIFVSNDGVTWNKVVNITSGLSTGSGQEYTSDVLRVGSPFTYFRFSVNAAVRGTGSQSSFNLAEFALYNIVIDSFDPEA